VRSHLSHFRRALGYVFSATRSTFCCFLGHFCCCLPRGFAGLAYVGSTPSAKPRVAKAKIVTSTRDLIFIPFLLFLPGKHAACPDVLVTIP
jgi:hypothetical protein